MCSVLTLTTAEQSIFQFESLLFAASSPMLIITNSNHSDFEFKTIREIGEI